MGAPTHTNAFSTLSNVFETGLPPTNPSTIAKTDLSEGLGVTRFEIASMTVERSTNMTDYIVTISTEKVLTAAESQMEAEKRVLDAYKHGRIAIKNGVLTLSSLSLQYALLCGAVTKDELRSLCRI